MLKSMVGTPLYMAPQILKREKYTSKCDVWSMGVLFYEVVKSLIQMLFGCLPWTGHSEFELIMNINDIPLTFPKTIPISENTKSFLEGCLHQTEDKRFRWQEIYEHPIFNGNFK
jgi:serine/threonine-protein kinase ULK/ATG1